MPPSGHGASESLDLPSPQAQSAALSGDCALGTLALRPLQNALASLWSWLGRKTRC